jgi:large subunit ribosomal protein L16
MLAPKRVQWRKVAKGKMRGIATRGNTIQFGEYGLVAVACGKITARQIEAARIAMSRSIKRGGNVWIRIFPDKPITKKAAETRMGSGKGNVEEWAAVIKPGRVLYEIGGIPANEAVEALRLAGHKLPVKCKPMTKDQLFKRNVERKVPMRKSAILSNTGATRLPQTPATAK